MARIFICYRREDTSCIIEPLLEELTPHFPGETIFVDQKSIPPGADFRLEIYRKISQIDVVVLLIGTRWMTILDDLIDRGGSENEDHVRVELESALRRGKRVIPTLVSPAVLPTEESLPATIKEILRYNAVVIDAEKENGFSPLVAALRKNLDITLREKIERVASPIGMNPDGFLFTLEAVREAAKSGQYSAADIWTTIQSRAQAEFGDSWKRSLSRLDIEQSEDAGMIVSGLMIAGIMKRDPTDHPSDYWGLGGI